MDNYPDLDREKIRSWVLIVEDEEDITEILKTELSNTTLNVLSTKKISEAIMKLNRQKFKLIVLDMRLQDGHGKQIIDMVRFSRTFMNFKTPIIVISGNLDAELVKDIRKDVKAILVKPFELSTFKETVLKIVNSVH